ncbi:uncharacterized protein PV09_05510 [Verruconis gallopava]|uniref:Zn(2)-C6 fungal-type domain-containing protein n=1 Tax=Verruconis gallopava TaxID=253628 RepID=A0A0D2A955_9PEZI|nr:uncharacterized protein PV09_05510 [Verruconis gallopava]KIW03298.1 hypothetical protein PV09_05510 [Verruconis gallopava]
MANIIPSHLELSERQFSRSGPNGSLDFAGQPLDRSASSDSYHFIWSQFSPQNMPLELNPTDGALCDNAFDFTSTDLVSAAQMNNQFVHTGDFPNHTFMATASHSFSGSNMSFEQSQHDLALPLGQTTQASVPPHVGQLPRNDIGSMTTTGTYHNQPWINGPNVKYELPAEEDALSVPPLSTQPSSATWSLEAPHRFAGSSFAQNSAWNSHAASNALNSIAASYAPSVLSHDSSPHVEGITTPDSSRSPMFSQAVPSSSSASSSGAADHRNHLYNQTFDQTPRLIQTAFVNTEYVNQDYNISPQSLFIDPSAAIQQLGRDPSHSPMSEYEIIDKSEAVSTAYGDDNRAIQSTLPKEEKLSAKRSRAPTSNKMRQDPDNFVSEYPNASGVIRRQLSSGAGKQREGKRVGGRSVGMHLSSEVAARAKQLRDEGSCWVCCFQRDSCSPGLICDRCQKRHQRAQMEHGLGCDRTKLNDLRPYFIPDFLARSGDQKVLKEFMQNHVRRWRREPIKIRINIIWGQAPMELELCEFEPKTAELVRHLQGVLDERTGKREWVNKGSPPLAMLAIEQEDRHAYERFIDNIVDNPVNLQRFVERCYKFEKDDFQSRLFRLIFEYQPAQRDEKNLRREIMRLQVITYIYSRASTIVNSDLHLLSTLRYTAANGVTYGKATTARLANRQLKYLYTSLWIQSMENVLKKLQQVLRSSRGGAKWSSAFVAVLGLGMAFETIQITAHTYQEADQLMGNSTSWEARERAEHACRIIDEKFFFLATLFRWKYHRGFNPFRNIRDQKVHEDLGPNALQLVQGVYELVQEKSEYLVFREQVAILNENKDRYTSRLVAKFLLAFWKPVA